MTLDSFASIIFSRQWHDSKMELLMWHQSFMGLGVICSCFCLFVLASLSGFLQSKHYMGSSECLHLEVSWFLTVLYFNSPWSVKAGKRGLILDCPVFLYWQFDEFTRKFRSLIWLFFILYIFLMNLIFIFLSSPYKLTLVLST